MTAFARDFRVIIHDHRGTGQSSRSRITYSVDQMADDVLRLLDVLKIDAVHYVGHATSSSRHNYDIPFLSAGALARSRICCCLVACQRHFRRV